MFKAWVYHCQRYHDHRTDPSARQPIVDPLDPPSASSLPAVSADSPSANYPSTLNPVNAGPVQGSSLKRSQGPLVVTVEDGFQPSEWNNCTVPQGCALTPSSSPPSSPATSHVTIEDNCERFYYSVSVGGTTVTTTSRYVHACFFLSWSTVLT